MDQSNSGIAVAVPLLVVSPGGGVPAAAATAAIPPQAAAAPHKDPATPTPAAFAATDATGRQVLVGNDGGGTPLAILNSETGELTPLYVVNSNTGEASVLNSAALGLANGSGGADQHAAAVVAATAQQQQAAQQQAQQQQQATHHQTQQQAGFVGGEAGGAGSVVLSVVGADDGARYAGRSSNRSAPAAAVDVPEEVIHSPAASSVAEDVESERLASYNHTVTLLMPPEIQTKESNTTEFANRDGACRNGSFGKAGQGCNWNANLVLKPGPKPGAQQYLLNKVLPYVEGKDVGGTGVPIPGNLQQYAQKLHVECRQMDACTRGSGIAGIVGGGNFEPVKIEQKRAQMLEQHLAGENPVSQVVGVLTMPADQRAGDGISVGMADDVSCQQVKLIQRQPQQPQHHMALLPPVYNRYGVATVRGGGAGTRVVSAVPFLQVPAGWVVNAGTPGFPVLSGSQQAADYGIDGSADHYMTDYDHQKSGHVAGWDMHNIKMSPAKNRRRKCEDRMCSNCKTRSTPFWRKDKHSGKPLCNACGLYYSKNDAPRPMSLWRKV